MKMFICVYIWVLQQHGSVYWQKGAYEKLQSLQPNRFLHDQLRNAFSLADSPTWQDSSTRMQCQELENVVGGPQVCKDTSPVL